MKWLTFLTESPWVNNCIGEYNQKYFLQFLLYVGLSSGYALSLIVTAWVHHDQYALNGIKGPYEQSVHNAKILHTIFLSIESALFGLFVLAVSCDQIQAILNDETAVEAVQRKGFHNRVAQSRSKITLIREVCGNGKTDDIVVVTMFNFTVRTKRGSVFESITHCLKFDSYMLRNGSKLLNV
ncbi:unnamed protein product [Onchocerca flexuosa]|uniref:Palmitoyltransferase n=1 Tax=Onchocerca flexuosa TaxID=387005 RepID=A0A183I525_9BILA|nr:unnamed protein product [Onchocerca flexuosa]